MRVVLLGALIVCASWAQSRQISNAEVNKVHRSALLIDTHNDVPMKTVKGFDIGKSWPRGSTDIPRLRSGGVGAVFFSAYVPRTTVAKKTAASYARQVIHSIR